MSDESAVKCNTEVDNSDVPITSTFLYFKSLQIKFLLLSNTIMYLIDARYLWRVTEIKYQHEVMINLFFFIKFFGKDRLAYWFPPHASIYHLH